MQFSILIKAAPYTSAASDSAYQFISAALQSGHQVTHVFFYQDGVHNASSFSYQQRDKFPQLQRWHELADVHDISLQLCSTAAKRRGLLDDQHAMQRLGIAGNADPVFEYGGLGQLVKIAAEAERFMVFG